MRTRKLTTIAKRWWRSVEEYSYYDDRRVDDILRDPDSIPALIRALVATAPPAGPQYVGTSVIESIHYLALDGRQNRALEHLLAARLTPTSTVAVLAGVYPDLLEEWGARDKLAAHLTTEQVDWLLDPNAPNRRDFL